MILECFHGFNLSVISFVFGSNKKCFLTLITTCALHGHPVNTADTFYGPFLQCRSLLTGFDCTSKPHLKEHILLRARPLTMALLS